MDTSQLKCMKECDSVMNGAIIGVFAADRLPKNLPGSPFGFIANTDVHTNPGQHWCAFYSQWGRQFDFFDTYARTPNQNSPYFRRWLDTNADTVQENHLAIQSNSSALCRLYCVLFLRQRLLGYTFQDFVNIFSPSDLRANDSFVADTMFNAYSKCVGNELQHNQTCSSLIKCFP